MNIINKANKSAFKDTAYGIISAGELYFAEQQLDINGMKEDKTIDLSTSTELQLKGEIPEGEILITKDGKTAIAVSNGRYCITKGINDKDVTVTEEYETCKFPKEKVNLPITWYAGTDYSNLTTATDAEGNVFAYKISDYAEPMENLEGVEMQALLENMQQWIVLDNTLLTEMAEGAYKIADFLLINLKENNQVDGIIIPETGLYMSSEVIDVLSFIIGGKFESKVEETETSISWNGMESNLECVQSTLNQLDYYCKVSEEIPSTNVSDYIEFTYKYNDQEKIEDTFPKANDGTYISLFIEGGAIVFDDTNGFGRANLTKGVWFLKRYYDDGTCTYISKLTFNKEN